MTGCSSDSISEACLHMSKNNFFFLSVMSAEVPTIVLAGHGRDKMNKQNEQAMDIQ